MTGTGREQPAMDDLASVQNMSFSLDLAQLLDYLPSSLLARLAALRSAAPPASPTTLDLDSLSPSTISDLMATPEWSSPLPLVSTPLASAKPKLPSAGDRSLLFGPLGFFTSGYMLGLFLMASPAFFILPLLCLTRYRPLFCTGYITSLFLLGCLADMRSGVEGCIRVAQLCSFESTIPYFPSTSHAHILDLSYSFQLSTAC
jgi:hypothetical protein